MTGFLLAAAVLYLGVFSHASRPGMFLDEHAILLVGGGTLAASLIAFRFKQLFSIVDMLFLAALFPKRRDPVDIANKHSRLQSQQRRRSERSSPVSRGSGSPLRGDNPDSKRTRKSFAQARGLYKRRYQGDYKVLNAIAKFPPAFGLLGASTGMIEMMSKLGTGGSSSIGAAMAIALVATFWGIAAANLVFLPLADHANKLAQEDQALRSLIIDGIVSAHRGDSDDMLMETLRSYLNVDQRKLLAKRATIRLRPLSQPTDETKVG